MGLDMFLEGKTYIPQEKRVRTNKYPVKGELVELGYWRKFADLHGFIISEFADDVDDCQGITLEVCDLQSIIEAIKENKLPHTEGFFFSCDRTKEQMQELIKETLETLENAIEFLELDIWNEVVYQASW